MKHAREDYNRIQDPSGLIPEAEPVFLLRGQDELAAPTLRYYADLCIANGTNHPGNCMKAPLPECIAER